MTSRIMVGATPMTMSAIFDHFVDAEDDEEDGQERERDDLVEEEDEAHAARR